MAEADTQDASNDYIDPITFIGGLYSVFGEPIPAAETAEINTFDEARAFTRAVYLGHHNVTFGAEELTDEERAEFVVVTRALRDVIERGIEVCVRILIRRRARMLEAHENNN